MVHKIVAPTMHELHDRMCRRVQYAHRDKLDLVTPMDAVLEHVYGVAESMDYEYDLKRVWVPPSRWTMMIRQYVDPDEARAWLDLIEKRVKKGKLAGRPVFRTRTVAARNGGKGTVRNLGSCMLTLSFTLLPTPTITLHSRACYLGYLSPLDMAVAHHMGRLAAERVGMDVKDFRFVWFLETAQMHKFRTIAFVLGDAEEEQRFLSAPYTTDHVALKRSHYHHDLWSQWNAEGRLYRDMPKFVSYQRLRKRWVAERMGYDEASKYATDDNKAFPPLPSTLVSGLTFEKIGLE